MLSSALLQVLRRTRASEGVAARRGLCSHPHWVGSHEPKLSFHCNNALRGFGGLICYHVIPCLTLTSTPVSPISADDTAHSGQKPIMLFRLLHLTYAPSPLLRALGAASKTSPGQMARRLFRPIVSVRPTALGECRSCLTDSNSLPYFLPVEAETCSNIYRCYYFLAYKDVLS